MTKRQLIDEILTLNHTAEPGFLSRFQDEDLREYLEHLQTARIPRVTSDPTRYAKYFATARQTPPAEFGLAAPAVSTGTDAAERAALLGAVPPADVNAETSEQPAPAPLAAPVLVEAAAAPAEAAAAARADEPIQVPVARALQDDDPANDDDDIPVLQPVALDQEMEEAPDDIVEDERVEDDPAESDLAKDDPDEEPTTRRDTVTARIARAWRQVPGDDTDAPAGAGADSAEDAPPAADDCDALAEEDSASSAADSDEEKPAKTDDAPAPALAGTGGKQEDSQDWLF